MLDHRPIFCKLIISSQFSLVRFRPRNLDSVTSDRPISSLALASHMRSVALSSAEVLLATGGSFLFHDPSVSAAGLSQRQSARLASHCEAPDVAHDRWRFSREIACEVAERADPLAETSARFAVQIHPPKRCKCGIGTAR